MVTTFPPRRRAWILSFSYDPSKVRVRYDLNFKSARRLPPEHEIGMRGPELHCPFRVSYLIRLLLIRSASTGRRAGELRGLGANGRNFSVVQSNFGPIQGRDK